MEYGKIHITIRDLEETKKDVLVSIVSQFSKDYPDVEGEAYLGYPIYFNEVTHEKTTVDMALITRIGIFLFNILSERVPNYVDIQNEIYIRVEEKFKRVPMLRNGVQLKFEFYPITITTTPIEKKEGLLAHSVNDALDIIRSKREQNLFSELLYSAILSAIQQAYGLNARIQHHNAGVTTKAYKIDQTYSAMESYDHSQMDAILADTAGIQRIRGMAGSGKTVVLARKAVETHMAHTDWVVVITYSTRALKDQLVRYVSKFYAERNDGKRYDPQKIRIMQAWGSATSVGVYYEICSTHGLYPLNFTQAKSKFGKAKAFSKACELVLQADIELQKMYDCILVDEAQDFDKNFLRLCLKVLGSEQRLVYAYDELQQLNEETMPTPKEIFGKDVETKDTPLKVCYRNQSPVIVTAHAIGMGMYREGQELPLQMPSSPDVWKAIGYESSNEIVDGEEVTLYRTPKTSPELLNVEKNDIISFSAYNDFNELKQQLILELKKDLKIEKLLPSDIMIIDMDAIGSMNNRSSLMTMISLQDGYESDLSIHMAGSRSPEDFFRSDSIVYTSIFRAKGNESFMVYIINAQRCINSLIPRSDRNALFTAITRSKGWVRVMGYGEEMKVLCREFDEVKKHNFQLYFQHYPTAEERKQMVLNNRDLDESTFKSIQDARNKIAKASGKAQSVQIMMEIMGVSTKEELMKMIMDESE